MVYFMALILICLSLDAGLVWKDIIDHVWHGIQKLCLTYKKEPATTELHVKPGYKAKYSIQEIQCPSFGDE